MKLVKAHAFGNDFLLVQATEIRTSRELPETTRALCERRRGIGADGLIVYETDAHRTSMRLLNADGSHSEISGNGVRCLAAWLAKTRRVSVGSTLEIATEAGTKCLELLSDANGRKTFRAAMGQPEEVARARIRVGRFDVDAITLRVGNPQCVVLGEVTEQRLQTIASALAVHPHFPEGTNVELALVEAADRVRVLIWERGVGRTESSGTGACAAAVAAIQYGGASRVLEVEAPGGTQGVEWREDGLYLTGWAEIIAEVTWLRPEHH